MKKWECKRQKQCAKRAKWFGESKDKGFQIMENALASKYKIVFNSDDDARSIHLTKNQFGRVVSDLTIKRIILALADDSDDDVVSDVIDYHVENGHSSILIHGIVRTAKGVYRHIHVAVDVIEEKICVYTVYDPVDEWEIWDEFYTLRKCFCPKQERRNFYRSIGRDVW